MGGRGMSENGSGKLEKKCLENLEKSGKMISGKEWQPCENMFFFPGKTYLSFTNSVRVYDT